MFLSLKLPTGIMVGGVDKVDNYLVVTNSHDGNSSLTAVVTPTRVVCANTLSVALGHSSAKIKIRHTSGAHNRMAEARKTLGITVKYLDGFQAIADQLLATPMQVDEFDALITAVWPDAAKDAKTTRAATTAENRRYTLLRSFRLDAQQERSAGTPAGARSPPSASTWTTPRRSTGDKVLARAERVATGGTDLIKHKALALLTR